MKSMLHKNEQVVWKVEEEEEEENFHNKRFA